MRQESIALLTSTATSGTDTVTSSAVDLRQCWAWALHYTFVGGTPAGNLSFQASMDGSNWVNIEAATAISAAGSGYKNFSDIGYAYGRVSYTNTSGTSALTVRVSKKGA